MRRKAVAILLALTLVLSMLPMTAFSSENGGSPQSQLIFGDPNAPMGEIAERVPVVLPAAASNALQRPVTLPVNRSTAENEAVRASIAAAQAGDTIIIPNGIYNNLLLEIRAIGTAESPVIIKAETPGQVIMTGTSGIRFLGSHHVSVEGLYLRDGTVTSGGVVVFDINSRNNRLYNSAVVNFNNWVNQTIRVSYVTMHGRYNWIDTCYLQGKVSDGGMIRNMHQSSNTVFGTHNGIRNSYILDFAFVPGGNAETIQVDGGGGSEECPSLFASAFEIRDNLFEHTHGESSEFFSLKANRTQITGNTFFGIMGAISIRSGGETHIEGNFFINDNVHRSGAFRTVGPDNVFLHNYISGSTMNSVDMQTGEYIQTFLTPFYDPINRAGANYPLNRVARYWANTDAQFINNIFVNNMANEFRSGSRWMSNWPTQQFLLLPHNTLLQDNIFYRDARHQHNANIFNVQPFNPSFGATTLNYTPEEILDLTRSLPNVYDNNQFFGANLGIAADPGLINQRPELAWNEQGLLLPTDLSHPIHQFTMLTPDDVGPAWMRENRAQLDPGAQKADWSRTLESTFWNNENVQVMAIGMPDGYNGNERLKMDAIIRTAAPVYVNGEIYAPANFLLSRLGAIAVYNGNTIDIRSAAAHITLTEDAPELMNRFRVLSVMQDEVYHDVVFIPVNVLERFGRTVFVRDNIVAIGNTAADTNFFRDASEANWRVIQSLFGITTSSFNINRYNQRASAVIDSSWMAAANVTNNATSWSSKGFGEWIQYDLGAIVNLESMTVNMGNTGGRTYSFDVWYSADGMNYSLFDRGLTAQGITVVPLGIERVQFVRIVTNMNNLTMDNTVNWVTFVAGPMGPTITGTVTVDQDPVAGVRVTVRGEGIVISRNTDSAGRFLISGLIEGDFDISIELPPAFDSINPDTHYFTVDAYTEVITHHFELYTGNALRPIITAQPVGVTVSQDMPHVASVTAESRDGGTLSFQWYVANQPVLGATDSTFVMSTENVGLFSHFVVVTNTNESAPGATTASVRSEIAVLNVRPYIDLDLYRFQFSLPANRWLDTGSMLFEEYRQISIRRIGSDKNHGAFVDVINEGQPGGPMNAFGTGSATRFTGQLSPFGSSPANGDNTVIEGARTVNLLADLGVPQYVDTIEFVAVSGTPRNTIFNVYVSDDGFNWKRMPLVETDSLHHINLTHAFMQVDAGVRAGTPVPGDSPITAYVTTRFSGTPGNPITVAMFAEPIIAQFIKLSGYGVNTVAVPPPDGYGVRHYGVAISGNSDWYDLNNFKIFGTGLDEVVRVSGISIAEPSLTLGINGTSRLTALVEPADASNRAVLWSSSDTSVATVGYDGTVTGISEGTATITVTTVDGGFYAQVTVTVSVVSVTGVTLSIGAMTLQAGQNAPLMATVTPANATNRAVTWSSSNTTVATVSDAGIVIALAPGTATISATTVDGGFQASCVVTVTESGGDLNFEFSLPNNRWASSTHLTYDDPYQLAIVRVGSDVAQGGAPTSVMNIGAAGGPINALSTESWQAGGTTRFTGSLSAAPGGNGSATVIEGARTVNFAADIGTPQLIDSVEFMMIGGAAYRGTFFNVYASDDGENWRRIPLLQTSSLASVNLTHALLNQGEQQGSPVPNPISAYVTNLSANAATPPFNITVATFAEPIVAQYVRVSLYGTAPNLTTAVIQAAHDNYGVAHLGVATTGNQSWIDFNNFRLFAPATPIVTPSDDATLEALTVDGANALPYAADEAGFAHNVANNVTSVTVAAAPTCDDASFAVSVSSPATFDAETGVVSGLPVGETTITVTVTAEDGIATRDYTIIVTRATAPVDGPFTLTLENFSPPGMTPQEYTHTLDAGETLNRIVNGFGLNQHGGIIRGGEVITDGWVRNFQLRDWVVVSPQDFELGGTAWLNRTVTMPDSNVTLQGDWEQHGGRYAIITFNANSGEFYDGETEVEKRSRVHEYWVGGSRPFPSIATLNTLAPAPEKAGGYTFVGWSTTNDGDVLSPGTLMDAPKTLYAIWVGPPRIVDVTPNPVTVHQDGTAEITVVTENMPAGAWVELNVAWRPGLSVVGGPRFYIGEDGTAVVTIAAAANAPLGQDGFGLAARVADQWGASVILDSTTLVITVVEPPTPAIVEVIPNPVTIQRGSTVEITVVTEHMPVGAWIDANVAWHPGLSVVGGPRFYVDESGLAVITLAAAADAQLGSGGFSVVARTAGEWGSNIIVDSSLLVINVIL